MPELPRGAAQIACWPGDLRRWRLETRYGKCGRAIILTLRALGQKTRRSGEDRGPDQVAWVRPHPERRPRGGALLRLCSASSASMARRLGGSGNSLSRRTGEAASAIWSERYRRSALHLQEPQLLANRTSPCSVAELCPDAISDTLSRPVHGNQKFIGHQEHLPAMVAHSPPLNAYALSEFPRRGRSRDYPNEKATRRQTPIRFACIPGRHATPAFRDGSPAPNAHCSGVEFIAENGGGPGVRLREATGAVTNPGTAGLPWNSEVAWPVRSVAKEEPR